MQKNALIVLKERGFIEQISDEKLFDLFDKSEMICYVGFDPSGASLHVGNLLPIIALSHIQQCGHHSIGLLGGGTGMIGDPSGKSEERVLLSEEALERNSAAIKSQLEYLLKPANPRIGSIRIINNADWLSKYRLIEFLRDIGKHFRVNEMLTKDSVKRRIEGDGISFTEFSYMLLQSADFLTLFDSSNCTVQFGGSDQWGNITAGIDLVRKVRGKAVYGATFPLITTASGQKLGKTEKGAIYLDPNMTSTYQFFQYWINADDKDAVNYLKWFTFLPLSEIERLEERITKEPENREAQRVLAYEVTKFVHGQEQADKAVKTSEILFGREISDVTDDMLEEAFRDAPSTEMSLADLESGLSIIDTMVRCGISKGRSAARRLIESGGVYLNNKRIDNSELIITKESLASGHTTVIRTGRRNYHLLRFSEKSKT